MVDTGQVLWVAIAAVGGVVRYLDVYLKTSTPPAVGPAFAHAFVSGFSGYMTALTVMHFDHNWALVAAGAGGYLGTQGLDWVTVVLRDRFGPKRFHHPHEGDKEPGADK